MEECKLVGTSIEHNIKLLRQDNGDTIDPIYFKSLIGCLRYITCIRLDILYRTGLISQFMKELMPTHMKVIKRNLCYIKCTITYGLLYFGVEL